MNYGYFSVSFRFLPNLIELDVPPGSLLSSAAARPANWKIRFQRLSRRFTLGVIQDRSYAIFSRMGTKQRRGQPTMQNHAATHICTLRVGPHPAHLNPKSPYDVRRRVTRVNDIMKHPPSNQRMLPGILPNWWGKPGRPGSRYAGWSGGGQ